MKTILGGWFMVVILSVTGCATVFGQDLQAAIKLTRSEQFKKADELYRSILQKHPEDANACFYYGENYLLKYFSDTLTYSYKRMSDSAANLFKTGIGRDPGNPLNFVGLGETALMGRDGKGAQANFVKALDLLPSKTNKKSKISEKEQAIVLMKMANAYLIAKQNDSSKVFPLLREAEACDKKNFDLYIIRGDAYMQILNDGSSAISEYNHAEELNPGSPGVKVKLGQLWMQANNLTYAMKYFSEAIKADSDYAPAYREMGYLLSKTNQHELAKQNFEKFLSLSSGNRMSRIQYINILFELKDYVEAIEQVNIIRSRDSSDNDFNRALGYAYYEKGQYDKGMYYMARFFDKVPSGKAKQLDYIYYGKLLSKENKDSLAGVTLFTAYKMDMTQTDLLDQALTAFIKGKNYINAIELIKRKIDLEKNVANNYYILGKLYYNLHDWLQADSAFSKDIALDSANINSYLWKAYSLVNLDPDTKEGLAKPVFELLIRKAGSDTTKNFDLKEAYSFLAYYYLLQYIHTKNPQVGMISKDYCEKVLVIDPPNEKAKIILKDLNVRLKTLSVKR